MAIGVSASFREGMPRRGKLRLAMATRILALRPVVGVERAVPQTLSTDSPPQPVERRLDDHRRTYFRD